ncbi:MAG: alkaline phosphatase family protein [Salinisphaera sp.]|nr:alkaline phosphatase family protein [Salinisphaera sp.]
MKKVIVIVAIIALAGCESSTYVPPSFGSPAAQQTAQGLPRPAHVVILWEENKAFGQIIGNPQAPFINALARRGALLTRAYGVTHPSQPNYLAFFSGTTHGVADDDCSYRFYGPNLASVLDGSGYTFTLYAEDLPHVGYTGCGNNGYARKHNPVADYPGLPATDNRPLRDFPKDFSRLPTVAWIIPGQHHDMHSGTVAEADRWLKRHLGSYITWAQQHNSLLIIAWDEDDDDRNNHIPLIFVGPMVDPGRYDVSVNHYYVLRTLEAMYALPRLGKSAQALPITGIWQTSGAREVNE